MNITRRTAPVDIFQGDDMARMSDLHADVQHARLRHSEAQQGPRRLGVSGDNTLAAVEAAEKAFDAFVDEANERAVTITVQAIGRKRWRALMAQHKPRLVTREVDGTQTEVYEGDDGNYGVNTDTFSRALLLFHDPATDIRTIISPEFTREELEEFLDDVLADGEVERLWVTAYHLNTTAGADPKLSKFGDLTPSSSRTTE